MVRTRRYVYWHDRGHVRGRRGMLIIFAFYENSSVLSPSTKVSPMFLYTAYVISDFIVESYIQLQIIFSILLRFSVRFVSFTIFQNFNKI